MGSDVSRSTIPAPAYAATRWRLAAISLGLAALAFLQDPGRIAADTKLDLVAAPGELMARALHLWEPLGFFGQLQNQGYGYLFPLGPFFWLGDVLGLPAWVIQRLWWSLLLIVAFLGMVRLARLMGMGCFWPRVVTGVAYALAPRMVTELGVLSVEVMPFALAPWVLIPLVSVASGGSYRRAAAFSGIAVLLIGGVNAVATAAVLPLGAWWILTRFRGKARLQLGGWWILAVAAASLWWAIPLLTLGRYSPPFLDWIESAAVTTSITTPDTVLRGTSQWVAYVSEPGGAVWPAGASLVTTPALIVITGLVAALGVAGLALRSTPHRLFLVGAVLFGWVLVSLGHVGDWSGLGAPAIRELLDGPLAPLRNTHKFDVLLRLPLALGMGFLIAWITRPRATRDGSRADPRIVWGRLVGGAMAGLVVLGALPLIAGEATRNRSFDDLPNYWVEAAQWLERNSEGGRALVLPGAPFGVYVWGRTNDEPLQPLATTPWVVRDAVPLASAGAIRFLDAVNERVDTGRGSPGLADALSRAGINWIVVRNDIDERRSGAPRAAEVRQALSRSPGITPYAGFGPVLPPYRGETTVVDGGLVDAGAAIEVWRVTPGEQRDPRVVLRNADHVTVLSGASEGVVDLADAGLLGPYPLVFSGDETPLEDAAGVTIDRGISDSFTRSEVDFGRMRGNRSAVLGPDEPFRAERRVHDYLPFPAEGRQSVATYIGGTIAASGDDRAGLVSARAGALSQAWLAIDGDLNTAWVPGFDPDVPVPWWQVMFDTAVNYEGLIVSFLVPNPDEAVDRLSDLSVTATTDTGTVTTPLAATSQPQFIALPRGRTNSIRLAIRGLPQDLPPVSLGIADVKAVPAGELSGTEASSVELPITRSVTTAGQLDGGPLVLRSTLGERAGCVAVAGSLVCAEGIVRYGPERTGLRRTVEVVKEGDYRVRILVRPRSGPALDELLEPLGTEAIRATASSRRVADPVSRPQSLVDGSLETAWRAASDDPQPEITLRWSTPREIRGVRLGVAGDLAASRPLTVTATVNGLPTTAVVDTEGVLRIPTQITDAITLRFDNVSIVRSLDPRTGEFAPLPLGINEISVLGATDLPKGPRPNDAVQVPCGIGPTLTIDGAPVLQSSVSVTVGEVLTDSIVATQSCGTRIINLPVGQHLVEVMSTPQFVVESVSLEPVDGPVTGNVTAVTSPVVEQWDAVDRIVDVPEASVPRLLEVTENFNQGWVASIDGGELQPVRVDGWRQAWLVPAGIGGQAELRFVPDRGYRLGLLAGALAVIGLILLAAIPPRRLHASSRAVGQLPGVLLAGGLVAVLLVTGPLGLLVAGVGAITVGVLASRSGVPWIRPATAGGAMLVAACIAALYPWPESLSGPAWVGILATAFSALAMGVLCVPDRQVGSRKGSRPSEVDRHVSDAE
jgi:arabinofuranan 3-O-arabinosyltransferase